MPRKRDSRFRSGSKKRRPARKVGSPPGSLEHVGEKRAEKVRLHLIEYAGEQLEERDLPGPQEALASRESERVSWINVDGLHDVSVIDQLGDLFSVHPLVKEDILHTGQRPKIEDFGSYIFIVLRMLRRDEGSGAIESEQVSLIVTSGAVLSFQECPGDVFEPVRERIRHARGRIRHRGPDYLAYALMDAVVDHYFVVLDALGEELGAVEEKMMGEPDPSTLQEAYRLKSRILQLHKSARPLRELVSVLQRIESPLVGNDTPLFLRDLYDHAVRVVDTIEMQRELSSGLADLYLSMAGHRMNEVMKVLTIMATIFIPLTFLAGIYGMNFEFMPELRWRWGYPALLGLMLAIFLGMLYFFKKRKWL